MAELAYIFNKDEIKSLLSEKKTYQGSKLGYSSIEKKMKLKPNHPQFYTLTLDVDTNFTVIFQHNNDEEFPEYSAILVYGGIRICRLDYHDAHRRNCKKELFPDRIANELHIHIYCKDCLEERLKYDSFVLSVNEKKLYDLSFQCFCALFCKIINLDNTISCERNLFS